MESLIFLLLVIIAFYFACRSGFDNPPEKPTDFDEYDYEDESGF